MKVFSKPIVRKCVIVILTGDRTTKPLFRDFVFMLSESVVVGML